ncbi:MAG TPA: type II secretion system protein GspG [Blastocatellia bacterium]
MRLISRKSVILVAVALSGIAILFGVAVFARELGAREARDRIARALGLANANKVHVKSISAIGNDAVVEASVDVAFQLTDDKKEGWTVTQVRTGDRCWESVELIRAAVQKEKVARTEAEMSNLATALESFRRENGSYVIASSGAGLIDKLSPRYLPNVVRLDAWSNEFGYKGEPGDYRLVSAGPDGKLGTADDLVMENGKMVQGAVR